MKTNEEKIVVEKETVTTNKVVVQVVQHLRAGGIECLVLEMLRSSQISKEEDMHIISLEGTKEEALKHWPRLLPYKQNLYFLNKPQGLSINCLLKVKRILQRLNTDVLHTHHIGPLFYAGLTARLARIQNRIHTEHDAWHMQDIKRRKLESSLLKWVKPVLVADAKGVHEQLKKYQPDYPSQIIHNGVDCKVFHKGNKSYARSQLGLPQKEIHIIGCAGRLTEVKGHKYLIEALKFLQDDCILVLAGEGESRDELEGFIKQNNLEKRVILLGNIDNMVYFYQSLDVFCMSSLNEGLPLSPLEAQACGVPVVLTDVGGSREACCPKTGMMVPAKDSSALAWGVRQVFINILKDDYASPREFVLNNRDFCNMLAEYRVLYR